MWRHVEARLSGWAATLVVDLSTAERGQAWLASRALLRRPASQLPSVPPLSVESAFEAAVQRLRAARAGDLRSAEAFERMVRDGYACDRDERLASFSADLDPEGRREVAALACFAHRQRGEPAREAVVRALRLAYDRDHDPDPSLRERSAGTLSGVLEQVAATPALSRAAASFVTAHQQALAGLLD
jgi:hypothetical protein